MQRKGGKERKRVRDRMGKTDGEREREREIDR